MFLSAEGCDCAPVSLFKISGHMSSPFMFYEGDSQGLVHSMS